MKKVKLLFAALMVLFTLCSIIELCKGGHSNEVIFFLTSFGLVMAPAIVLFIFNSLDKKPQL